MRPRLPSSVHFTLPKSAKYGNPGKAWPFICTRSPLSHSPPFRRQQMCVSPTLGCGGAPWSGSLPLGKRTPLLRSIAEVDVCNQNATSKADHCQRKPSGHIGSNPSTLGRTGGQERRLSSVKASEDRGACVTDQQRYPTSISPNQALRHPLLRSDGYFGRIS